MPFGACTLATLCFGAGLADAAVPKDSPASGACLIQRPIAPRRGDTSPSLELWSTAATSALRAEALAAGEVFLTPRAPASHDIGHRSLTSTAVSGDSASSTLEELGVVCPTFLHPDIQRRNLVPLLRGDGVDAVGFVKETINLCGGGVPLEVENAYTGSWSDTTASQIDVSVLGGLTEWLSAHRPDDLATMAKPPQPHNFSSMAKMLRHIATTPTNISSLAPGDIGPLRILDFGCGSGKDIVALRHELHVAAEDALCLDLFEVKQEGLTSLVLDASSDDTYRRSLDAALAGNSGSVGIAFSIVTFHHILPSLRPLAISFIRRALSPGGIFIMAEWDNGLVPSRSIYYDLVHLLGGMIFYGHAPSQPGDLNLNTTYLSVDDWIAEVQSGGLPYEADRSRIVELDGRLLTPQEVADKTSSPNRDFFAVWAKP